MDIKTELFNKLQAKGIIPADTKVEDVSDNYVLNLATEVNKQEDRLSADDVKKLMADMLDKELKDRYATVEDVKSLKLPGWEDVLNDNEKALIANVDAMTDDQKRQIANKQLFHLVKPFAGKAPVNKQLAINNETTDAQGGYLVEVQFIAQVSKLLETFGVARRNANIFRMNSKTATKPKLNAKPTGAYVAEQNAKPESNPTFTQLTYTRHDYAFITGVTKQLLEDSSVDLIGLFAELAAYDFARNEDNQVFNGTSLTNYLANPANGIPSITTGGSAITSTSAKNLYELQFASAFTGEGSKLYTHRTWLSQFLNIVDDQNRPIFSLTDQMNIMNTRRIMGVPFELVEVMQPAFGNNYLGNADAPVTGDIIAYYGDMAKASTLAIRKDMEILVSDVATVGGNSAYEKNLVFWRFEMAHDFNIEQPQAMVKLVLGS